MIRLGNSVGSCLQSIVLQLQFLPHRHTGHTSLLIKAIFAPNLIQFPANSRPTPMFGPTSNLLNAHPNEIEGRVGESECMEGRHKLLFSVVSFKNHYVPFNVAYLCSLLLFSSL